jgi:phage regulator Rha-like protein
MDPFKEKPPRLKDLVNEHVMGDVWIRDTPFGPVTDSLKIAQKFGLEHTHVMRSVDKCLSELSTNSKLKLSENIIENNYSAGPEGRKRSYRKVDITEFGLALLLLYINSPKARSISAEILYRFFILKTYIEGLNERQIGAVKGYYRKKIKDLKNQNRL